MTRKLLLTKMQQILSDKLSNIPDVPRECSTMEACSECLEFVLEYISTIVIGDENDVPQPINEDSQGEKRAEVKVKEEYEVKAPDTKLNGNPQILMQLRVADFTFLLPKYCSHPWEDPKKFVESWTHVLSCANIPQDQWIWLVYSALSDEAKLKFLNLDKSWQDFITAFLKTFDKAECCFNHLVSWLKRTDTMCDTDRQNIITTMQRLLDDDELIQVCRSSWDDMQNFLSYCCETDETAVSFKKVSDILLHIDYYVTTPNDGEVNYISYLLAALRGHNDLKLK